MTTYAEDTDITNAEPSAADYLPTGDSGSFERLRTLAYDEINRKLLRRNPPVNAPTDLADADELTWAEVCHVLRDLYEQAASRTGSDVFWTLSKEWGGRWESEIGDVPVTVSTNDTSTGGVSAGTSIEIMRS